MFFRSVPKFSRNGAIFATELTALARPYATYKRFSNSGLEFDFSRLLTNRYLAYFLAGSAALYVYNLDAAPFTGRRRLLWIPYWLENKIGDYTYRQLLHQYKNIIVPLSDPHYAQILKVMNRLLATALDNAHTPSEVAHLKSLNWTIHIIETPREPPNAFILPNGKIFIFSSILPICQNEDGLATVLSHELSHLLAQHSLEQLSKQPIYVLLSTLLYAATGISGFTDLLITGLFQMPASREMESEADRIGCELMARLCFNFKEAVNFWVRMQNFEERLKQGVFGMPSNAVVDFFSTHPNTRKRIQHIQLWVPKLVAIQESSNCHQWAMFQEHSRNFFGRRD